MGAKLGIDFLSLVGRYTNLRRVASTRGGQWAGACPKCGGKDRFVVEPEYELWMCRQCRNGKWDDAIAFMRWIENLSYREALDRLGKKPLEGQAPKKSQAVQRAPGSANALIEAPAFELAWQSAAQWLVEEAEERLWSAEGAKALNWLMDVRKLAPEIIRRQRLGYHAADGKEKWGSLEVFLPRGIVIPWWIEGQIWKINMRPPLPIGGRKYMLIAGSANGLYNADALCIWKPVVMVEGEMNALSILSATDEFVPVGTGAVSWARSIRWVARLAQQQEILLAFDRDTPGQQCSAWWQAHLPHAHIHPLPDGAKDANELLQRSKEALLQWLEPYSMWPGAKPNAFCARAQNAEGRARIREAMQAHGWRLTDIGI